MPSNFSPWKHSRRATCSTTKIKEFEAAIKPSREWCTQTDNNSGQTRFSRLCEYAVCCEYVVFWWKTPNTANIGPKEELSQRCFTFFFTICAGLHEHFIKDNHCLPWKPQRSGNNHTMLYTDWTFCISCLRWLVYFLHLLSAMISLLWLSWCCLRKNCSFF